jgi:alpha-amylase/alpha-mannosidase (GH57 family)
MLDPRKTKYVCIHGHFYQPPRENPWLDDVEREPSAAPHHDWNQRISLECYRANTAARLVDGENRVLALRNNYGSLSYNFGPTLLAWMERHAPRILNAIQDADRDSCERFNGHGNAIAQVYNHLIMPLANRRDKITQVLWGERDFVHRFGRTPEGMWLAETAVDLETLGVLAEAGIRFTILSPFQAHRWRLLEPESPWHDAAGGTIPSGQPYRCFVGGGRFIDVFFYDAQLAQAVAFERALEHSSRLIDRVEAAYQRRGSQTGAWLAHAATDGESYGHHFKFGDMALAAAFRYLEDNPLAQVTNYGAFLAAFPPVAEVEIVENSAWSCAHGLGRWQADCGCRIGGGPDWHQKWRAPLREGLNQLRDALAVHFETEMARLVHDPWAARNDYINVLLDAADGTDPFITRHAGRTLAPGERVRLLQLLEMQRAGLLMFTSCGWFFDDISGLESVMVLRHAARAMQLAEATGLPGLERQLLESLKQAPSNQPEYANGADVYVCQVKPHAVGLKRVVVNHAIRTLTRQDHNSNRLYCFQLTPKEEDELGPNPIPCMLGNVTVEDTRTGQNEDYLYGVMHFGGLDFRCSVMPYPGQAKHRELLANLQKAGEQQNTVMMMRVLDKEFGTVFLDLNDCLINLRQDLAVAISQDRLRIYTDFQRYLYETNSSLMISMHRVGVRPPAEMRGAVRRVLSTELDRLVREILEQERIHGNGQVDWKQSHYDVRSRIGRLQAVLQEACKWDLRLRVSSPARQLGEEMVRLLEGLTGHFDSGQAARLMRLVLLCRDLDTKPELWLLQTLYYRMVQGALKEPALTDQLLNQDAFLETLDDFMHCRFAELLRIQTSLDIGDDATGPVRT